MVTKGIVTELINSNQARVRLPLLDSIENVKGSTSNNNLSIATVCSISNTKHSISVGDIVYVSFEDNDKSKPVILGHLIYDKTTNSQTEINVNALNVKTKTNLSKDTTIGNVKYNEIAALSGIQRNIQAQLNNLSSEIIYDCYSQDSKLNWGYVSGIQGDVTVDHDFSEYTKLKIYVMTTYSQLSYELDLTIQSPSSPPLLQNYKYISSCSAAAVDSLWEQIFSVVGINEAKNKLYHLTGWTALNTVTRKDNANDYFIYKIEAKK